MNNTPPRPRGGNLLGWSGPRRPPSTTERRRGCAAEVWIDALGKRPEDMTQTEARKVRDEQQMNNQTTAQRRQPLSGGK